MTTDNRPSTVVAQLPRRASMRLRLAHRVSSMTLRKFIDLTAWIDRRGILSRDQLLAIAGHADFLAAPIRPPRGTQRRGITFGDFRAEWLWPSDVDDPATGQGAAIIYFHGGALIAGGLNSHRRLAARIAAAAGTPLLNVEYRQIPRAHIIHTVDDCVRAYQYLLDSGFDAARIIAAGDSAGGGLAFSLAIAARDRGLPLPGAVVAIAPWANYDPAAKLTHPNNTRDALLSGELLAMVTKWGMEVNGELDPAWSPVNHDFADMPAALIQVSSSEMLLGDAMELAARYAAAGRPLTLQLWDNAIHVFHAAADVIPDARDAISEIGSFVRNIVD